jgi:Domain of unknown function (DUF4347)
MTSKLYIYDKSSELDRNQAAGRFSNKFASDKDILTIGVPFGIGNLQKVFEQLAGNNQTFDRVVFQTHGDPGKIYFGSEAVNADVLKTRFTGYESMFPKYTRMYFDGCNVAEGEAGTNFLLAAGLVFLRGGGEAFGWKTLGHGVWGWIPFYGGHTIHFGSNLKKIRFFPGGAPNWAESVVQ